MGYIIVSTEDLHLFPDATECVEEFKRSEIESIRLYDDEGEELGMFNFTHVVMVQSATKEEVEEFAEAL